MNDLVSDGLEASAMQLAGPFLHIRRKRNLRTITMRRTLIEALEEKLRPTLKGVIRRISEYGPPHGPPTTRSQKSHDLGEGGRSIEPMEGCGRNAKVKRSVGEFCGLKGGGTDAQPLDVVFRGVTPKHSCKARVRFYRSNPAAMLQ
jgi:hypothetical protein